MADAPTLTEIIVAGHDFSIHCPRCRLVVMLFPAKVAETRGADKPIDRFRFRCGPLRRRWPADGERRG